MNGRSMSTVIVVGAGASKEFRLPTGAELMDRIAAFCKVTIADFGEKKISNPLLAQAIHALSIGKQNPIFRNTYAEAGRRISENMPLAPSIDNYLHTHQSHEEIVSIGKIAIAATIIEAEAASLLSIKGRNVFDRPHFNGVKDTWIAALFRILVSGKDFEGFIKALGNITFVSFNYDRCLGQYLVYAALSYFNLDDGGVQRVIQTLNIMHPYGSLGGLEWMGSHLQGFGKVVNEHELIDISKRIKTFTEGAASGEEDRIRSAIHEASNLIFLGFSFQALNMQLLGDHSSAKISRVMATGKGISEESIGLIKKELAAKFSNAGTGHPFLSDRTCAGLFQDHQRYLEINLFGNM